MNTIAKRDRDTFLVEDEGAFFLVDLMDNVAIQANPPNSIAGFLKSGYWAGPGEIDDKTQAEIEEAMTHKKTRA